MSSDGGGNSGVVVVDQLGDLMTDVPFPNDKMGRQLESMLHQFLTQVLKHHFSKSSSTTTTDGEQEENVENVENDKNDENEKMDEENGENDEIDKNDDENDSSSIPLDMNVISSMIDTIQFDTLPQVSTTSLSLCLYIYRYRLWVKKNDG